MPDLRAPRLLPHIYLKRMYFKKTHFEPPRELMSGVESPYTLDTRRVTDKHQQLNFLSDQELVIQNGRIPISWLVDVHAIGTTQGSHATEVTEGKMFVRDATYILRSESDSSM